MFGLLLRLAETVSIGFLFTRKKIATQGQTRTFRITISLHYHYTATPIRQNFEKIKYIN